MGVTKEQGRQHHGHGRARGGGAGVGAGVGTDASRVTRRRGWGHKGGAAAQVGVGHPSGGMAMGARAWA